MDLTCKSVLLWRTAVAQARRLCSFAAATAWSKDDKDKH